MKRTAKLVTALLIGMAPALAGAAPVLLDRVVAEVNGEVILLSDIAERVERLEKEIRGQVTDAQTLADASRSLRSRALETMIDELLVIQEGTRLGVEVGDEDVDRALDSVKKENNVTSEAQFQYVLQSQNFTLEEYRSFLKKQMMIHQTRRKALGGMEITDEEIRRYYEEHKEEFRRPASAHLRHILLRLPQEATPGQVDLVNKRALDLKKKIAEGLQFEAAAARFSEDPAAANGGDIGTIAAGQMLPEFEAVAFTLPVGEVSEPVRTQFGLHLLQVVERTDGSFQPVEEVADRLREFLQDERAESKQAEWLTKLRELAYVKVYEKPEAVQAPPVVGK